MSKEVSPQFPFYAQDFLAGVLHMTMEERGMYITLLSYEWAHGSIPKKRVGFLIGMPWESAPEMLTEKFTDHGETLTNERLEAERKKREIFRLKQSENGKKGGRPKKTKSQKKPLDNDNDKDKDNKVMKGGMGGNVELPFASIDFEKHWTAWKTYKKEQHKFRYSSMSEKAALTKLVNLSGNNPATAVAIMQQSIAQGWKGFFELKQKEEKLQSKAQKIISLNQRIKDKNGYE